MSTAVWVAELLVSEPAAAKITNRHHLDPVEVQAALLGVRGLAGRWDHDPVRGSRLLVRVGLGTDMVLAVLYPVESPPLGDVWALATAFRFDRDRAD
ncbi:hypothetical protein BH23ACT2_BH23ACT2_14740 [soil metagenome]